MSAKSAMKARKAARKAGKDKPVTKPRRPSWKGGGKKDEDGKTFRQRNDEAAEKLLAERKAAADKAPAVNPHYATGPDDGTESDAGDNDDGGGNDDGGNGNDGGNTDDRLDHVPTVTRTDAERLG